MDSAISELENKRQKKEERRKKTDRPNRRLTNAVKFVLTESEALCADASETSVCVLTLAVETHVRDRLTFINIW